MTTQDQEHSINIIPPSSNNPQPTVNVPVVDSVDQELPKLLSGEELIVILLRCMDDNRGLSTAEIGKLLGVVRSQQQAWGNALIGDGRCTPDC